MPSRISNNPLPFEKTISYWMSRITALMFDNSVQRQGIPKSMGNQEWRVMAILASRGQQTNHDICTFSSNGHVTVSRAIKGLKAKGLIETRRSTQDKRLTLVQLTEAGLELHDDIAPKRIRYNEDINNGFSEKERETLFHLIKKLEIHLRDLNCIKHEENYWE